MASDRASTWNGGRGSESRRDFRSAALTLVVALVLPAWTAETMAMAPKPMIVPAGSKFECTPVRVWDGDGPIWCAEGPKVRLAGIAAREADGSCRSNQPCPRASAAAAKYALVSLLGGHRGTAPEGHSIVKGPHLECISEGSAGGNRTAAWCVAPTTGDLSCSMVATGTVLKWPRYWRGHRC